MAEFINDTLVPESRRIAFKPVKSAEVNDDGEIVYVRRDTLKMLEEGHRKYAAIVETMGRSAVDRMLELHRKYFEGRDNVEYR